VAVLQPPFIGAATHRLEDTASNFEQTQSAKRSHRQCKRDNLLLAAAELSGPMRKTRDGGFSSLFFVPIQASRNAFDAATISAGSRARDR
jgi:hypothetical protein